MSSQYYSLSTDMAWMCASNAYDLAVKINYKKGMGESLLNLGQITQERGNSKHAEKYFRQANNLYDSTKSLAEWNYTNCRLGYNLSLQLRFDEARALYNKTLPYYAKINDKERVAYFYKWIGTTYDQQGYYEKAFEYFRKDLDISHGIKDGLEPRRSLFMWSNYYIGTLYKDAGDYKSALIYYRLSMERAKEKMLPDFYNERMGDVCVLQNNYDSARYYYEVGHDLISERIIDPVIRTYFLSDSKINIGETYLAQKNYNKALEYFKEPLQYSFGANFLTMRVLYDVARIYEGQNKFILALQSAKQLLEIAHVSGARQYICDGFELHWRIYDQQGKTDSAYKYHLQYSSMKDSITQDKQLRNMHCLK